MNGSVLRKNNSDVKPLFYIGFSGSDRRIKAILADGLGKDEENPN